MERANQTDEGLRMTGIGGSDMPAVLGVDRFRTATDVWHEKLGLAPPREVTGPMRRGLALEPIAAQMYAEHSSYSLLPGAFARHAEIEWLIGHVDRYVVAPQVGVLEAKCPNAHTFGECQRSGLPDGWYVQGQHYLALTGYSWCAFAVLSAERWELIVLDVRRDEDMIARLTEAGHRFWRCVLDREPPEPVEPPVVVTEKRAGPVLQVDGDAWQEAVEMWTAARGDRDRAEAAEAEARERLVAAMGGHDAAQGGGARVYHREQAGRARPDLDALAGALVRQRDGLNALLETETFDMPPLSQRLRAWLDGNPVPDPKAFRKRGKPFRSFRVYLDRDRDE